jgi:hypothetical protein
MGPNDGQHLDHLNYWTLCSVNVMQSTFSLTELLTMTTFNIASESVKFSLESAEIMVNLFDGLFGDTETSRCIAAFASLWCDLLKSSLEDMGYDNTRFGQFMMMGHMAKSIMAYCCLQYATRKRWKSSINLIPVYTGNVSDTEPSTQEAQALWLASQKFEETATESNTTPSEETVVDYETKELSFVDFRLVDSLIKTQRIRRRSVDGVSPETVKAEKRYRSKTESFNEGKDVMNLFSRFELDQLRAKSHRFLQDQEVLVAESVSQSDEPQSNETIVDETQFQAPDLIPFLEQAERFSKFAFGAYGTSMMKILK